MTATGRAIMEVVPGSIAGTAVDRFLDDPGVDSSPWLVVSDCGARERWEGGTGLVPRLRSDSGIPKQ